MVENRSRWKDMKGEEHGSRGIGSVFFKDIVFFFF